MSSGLPDLFPTSSFALNGFLPFLSLVDVGGVADALLSGSLRFLDAGLVFSEELGLPPLLSNLGTPPISLWYFVNSAGQPSLSLVRTR